MAEWTTTPPTEPGYYWIREGAGPDEVIRLRVDRDPGIYYTGWDEPKPADEHRGRLWWPIAIEPPPGPGK